jgi:hypothetical protein
MSKHIKRGKGSAQYNYYPERTRPGGVGEVRQPDTRQPWPQPDRPGHKPYYNPRRPRR